jgi:flagellar basal-body rod modification protein FlgD
MSIASVAAQQTSTAAAAQVASAATGTNALTSLSDNFQSFLGMLMTQLQNQDPTSPMDANQFTSELVQFSGVEQQINTNDSLTQLIQLTQGDTAIQAAAMVGKQITVTSPQMALQNGTGAIDFTATAGENVAISVADANGTVVKTAQLTATQGTNTWTWNGVGDNGSTLADGAYTVSVTGAGAGGTSAALPFSVIGTATGVQVQNGSVQLQMGAVSVPFASLQSVNAVTPTPSGG